MKNLMIVIVSSYMGFSYAQPVTASMQVTTSLNAVCNVSAESVDFGTISMTTTLIIRDKIVLQCSRGVVADVGFLADYYNPADKKQRYMVGENPNNTDKIVYQLGYGINNFSGDGSKGSGIGGVYTGSGTPTSFNSLLRIYVVGAVIDGVYQTGDFRVKADNYKSNATLILTY